LIYVKYWLERRYIRCTPFELKIARITSQGVATPRSSIRYLCLETGPAPLIIALSATATTAIATKMNASEIFLHASHNLMVESGKAKPSVPIDTESKELA
jgi:hypothetical protein